MSNVDQLVDRFLNDAAFHTDMLADPQAAIQASGLTLDAADWESLQTVVSSLGESGLAERISKGGQWN